ncbi:DUF4233 domain-containing protein [Jatrophihabitans telluris]|uniref:DUF4233 domain-containing protein n=1 Tax=Jatrophihabitans telluris TaxID=2038343 RepID=A0ABY4R1I7_9ACTN|nr:DUF4233 domain-containing protein [Jatrophihabitans telluris]UQX89669.1 DUF4233 domain-containing protein [Jatrophihabitans telluris]
MTTPDQPGPVEAEHSSYVPSPEELSARAHKANRATRGALAALLCLEAFVVLLIPRAIAQTAEGLDGFKTIVLVVFAVILVLTGFMLRRRWGIGLGSALQLVLVATIALVPVLAVVVVIFLALWLYMLQTRHQLVGTPSGWRMLIS